MSWAIDVAPAVVALASTGDRTARESLASALLRPVYNLAVRFFYEPADAEEATQEALMRILGALHTFRGESRFSTWAYRVACSALLDARRARREGLTLAEGAESLEAGLAWSAARPPAPEDDLLVEEVKLSCTTALLVCLPREQRIAYVLGEIVGLPGPEAAAILEIRPDAFRQRLASARRTVRGFLGARCGLIDRSNPCRCARQVGFCAEVGWIDPHHLRFADKGDAHRDRTSALDQAFNDAAVYASHPDYRPTPELAARLRAVLDAEPSWPG